MRHFAMALIVLLAATTALAQEVFLEHSIDPITDLNTSALGFQDSQHRGFAHARVRCGLTA